MKFFKFQNINIARMGEATPVQFLVHKRKKVRGVHCAVFGTNTGKVQI